MTDWNLLIHRHLEGTLTDEEGEALHAQLREDTDLRRRLAVMAFDQAQLRDILATETALPKPRGFRLPAAAWVPAAAAVLLVAGLLLYGVFGADPSHEIVSGNVTVDGAVTNEIVPGASVEAVGAEPAVIKFADGSLVELESSSITTFLPRSRKQRDVMQLKEGRGRFTIVPGRGVFEVQTVCGALQVKSGKFEAEMHAGVLVVNVTEGPATLKSGSATRIIAAGERAVFGRDPFSEYEGFVRVRVTANKGKLALIRIVEGDLAGWNVQLQSDRNRKDDQRKYQQAFLTSLRKNEELEVAIKHLKAGVFVPGTLTEDQLERARKAKKNRRK